MEKQKPRIAKTILYNNRSSGAATFTDFKLYYTTIVIKPHGIAIKKDRLLNQI